MAGLILPDWAWNDDVQSRYWNPILQELDSQLFLIRPFEDPPEGMKANRWHICRFSANRDRIAYFPIETPDGGFREMDSAMLEALKRRDSHSSRSREAERQRLVRERAQVQAKKDAAADERKTEFAERLESKMRTSVSVPKKA